jgi:hypothetical protein
MPFLSIQLICIASLLNNPAVGRFEKMFMMMGNPEVQNTSNPADLQILSMFL